MKMVFFNSVNNTNWILFISKDDDVIDQLTVVESSSNLQKFGTYRKFEHFLDVHAWKKQRVTISPNIEFINVELVE